MAEPNAADRILKMVNDIQQLMECDNCKLNDWELEFMEHMIDLVESRPELLTDKQIDKIEEIWEKA